MVGGSVKVVRLFSCCLFLTDVMKKKPLLTSPYQGRNKMLLPLCKNAPPLIRGGREGFLITFAKPNV